MTLFDFGELLFQAGICLTAGELLGQWRLVPAAFRCGLAAGSLEQPSDCPPELSTPRRDRSLSLMYRVLPGQVCLFRPQWVGWFQTPFNLRGIASWSDGRLRIVGRHPVGPWLCMFALLLVAIDGMVGFLRQGEPLNAISTALVFGGIPVVVPLYFYDRERARFQQFAAELKAELGYPARAAGN